MSSSNFLSLRKVAKTTSTARRFFKAFRWLKHFEDIPDARKEKGAFVRRLLMFDIGANFIADISEDITTVGLHADIKNINRRQHRHRQTALEFYKRCNNLNDSQGKLTPICIIFRPCWNIMQIGVSWICWNLWDLYSVVLIWDLHNVFLDYWRPLQPLAGILKPLQSPTGMFEPFTTSC